MPAYDWMACEAGGCPRDADARHTGAPRAFPHNLGQERTSVAAAKIRVAPFILDDRNSAMCEREPRQLNVQQQNASVERSLRAEASYWRRHGVPPALASVGVERGIQWERSIVVELGIDFPGMPSIFGRLVTQDQRFIAFEIDTTDEIRVEQWEDITSAQNFNEHNRGTGVGRGALALRVLRELSA